MNDFSFSKYYVRFNLNLEVEYATHWGESVWLELAFFRASGQDSVRRIPMLTGDGRTWHLDLPISERDIADFCYEFLVMNGDQVVRREWNAVPRRFPVRNGLTYVCRDYWRDIPSESHLYSSAYTSLHPYTQGHSGGLLYYDRTLVFRVQAPGLRAGEALALVGSQRPLGICSPHRTVRMNRAGTNEWILSVNAVGLYLPFEYKYVVIDEQTGNLLRWEDGENRHSPSYGLFDRSVLIVMDQPIRLAIKPWRVAGLVVPLFSLRSEGGLGIAGGNACTAATPTGRHNSEPFLDR